MTTEEIQASILAEVRAQARSIKNPVRASIRKQLLAGWLKEGDAAIYLDVSADEIGRMRRAGRLRAGLIGKQHRYKIEDLDRAVAQGRTV